MMEEEVETAGPVLDQSMMDRIRQQHDKLLDAKELDLDLPGYDGLLVARYRVLNLKTDIQRISTRIQRDYKSDSERALYGTMDSMAHACISLFARVGDELKPLHEALGIEGPVRYDESLVRFMGWPEDNDGQPWTARTVILRLFGGVETMVLDHGRTMSNWMANVTKGANEDFLSRL